jgi:hypothetical protein
VGLKNEMDSISVATTLHFVHTEDRNGNNWVKGACSVT